MTFISICRQAEHQLGSYILDCFKICFSSNRTGGLLTRSISHGIWKLCKATGTIKSKTVIRILSKSSINLSLLLNRLWLISTYWNRKCFLNKKPHFGPLLWSSGQCASRLLWPSTFESRWLTDLIQKKYAKELKKSKKRPGLAHVKVMVLTKDNNTKQPI